MIVRGLFCVGLVWLCMPVGPRVKLGADAELPFHSAAAGLDPVATTSASWRQGVAMRLAEMKIELRAATRQPIQSLVERRGKGQVGAADADHLAGTALAVSAGVAP
jgi:hypothetical protein